MTSADKIYVTALVVRQWFLLLDMYEFQKTPFDCFIDRAVHFPGWQRSPFWLFACLVKLISFSTINRLIVSLTGLTPEVTVEKVPFCRNGSSLEREELRRQWLNPFACRKRQKGCKNLFNKHLIPSVNFLLWNIEHWLKQPASLMQRTKFRPMHGAQYAKLFWYFILIYFT